MADINLPTIVVTLLGEPEHPPVVINASDFDEKLHKRHVAKPKVKPSVEEEETKK